MKHKAYQSLKDSFKPTVIKIIISIILAYFSGIVGAFLTLFFWGFTDSPLMGGIIGFIVSFPSLPFAITVSASNIWPDMQNILNVVGLVASVIWSYLLICSIIWLYKRFSKDKR